MCVCERRWHVLAWTGVCVSCTTYEGSSFSLVPFIDSSRRATQPFTVGGRLVMGLLHRYTSRRFIKPPISSGSDVNLLLHVVTTQTHTQAHAHTQGGRHGVSTTRCDGTLVSDTTTTHALAQGEVL